MMTNPKKQLSELLSAMHFPKQGDSLGDTKVVAASAQLDSDILRYEVVFPKGTKTKQIPNLLKKFFSMQVIPSQDNLVVRHHDYTVKPKAGNVAVVGAMHIPPVVRANPSIQDFDHDYSKMEMTNPETYFRKHDAAPLNSPQFRAKMFTFVSMMGENYGYGTDKHIFHRRASLIMPKIKITKAVPQAKMMYHTHPRKDEPSLSSPDDYLLYMDLSHKPRSIRHFYTVMADRMDYFTVKPKKDSKDNYVKLNEDKILKELTDEMDDIEAKWDKKTPKTGDYQDDLRFCENITRDFVKWLNKRYSKYFTITYKCYYKVKKNPPEPEIEDLHLGDEMLEKSLDSIKSRDYSWTPSVQSRAHEDSVYWHQMRYLDTLGDSAKTLGISPQGSMKRAYSRYMGKAFEESKYSYYDALNILNLAHDISSGDSKIRDGGELSSRLSDICTYLELDETSTETLLFLEEVIHNENLFTEEAKTMCGDFYGLALLSSYAIQAVGAIGLVKEGKKDYTIVEYEIYSMLKEETQKRFEDFLLGEKDHRGYATGENAPASRGFVDSFLNPPQVSLKRTDLEHVFPPEAFAYDFDLVKEALDEFNVEKYEPTKSFVTGRNALNLRFPVTTGRVSMIIQPSTGKAQIFVTGRPNAMEDALDAVTKVGTALVRYGLPGINPEDYDVQAIDVAQNPQTSQVIAIAGPSGAGKSTTIRNLLKLLPKAKTVPTVTTRKKRKSDKPGERIFISTEQFKKEMREDKLVAAELQKNGNYYGRRKSDFEGADYVIIDVNPRGVNAIKRAYPNAFTAYLEPVEDPEFIRKRLLRRGDMSPQEAKGRASIIPSHIKDSKKIDFDARIKTKQGEFAKIALELEPMIPKQNPSALTGRMIKRVFNPLKSKMAERKMSAEEAANSRLERAEYQRQLKNMEFLDTLSPEERQRYEFPEAVEYLQIGKKRQYREDLTPGQASAPEFLSSVTGGAAWKTPTTTKTDSYGSRAEDFIEDTSVILGTKKMREPVRFYGTTIGPSSEIDYFGLKGLFLDYMDMTSQDLEPLIMTVGNVKSSDKESAKTIFMDAVNTALDMKLSHVFKYPELYEGHILREIIDAYALVGQTIFMDHEITHRSDDSSYTMRVDFSKYDEEGNIVKEYRVDEHSEKYGEDQFFTDMAESTPQMIESVNSYFGLATQYVSNDTYLVVSISKRKQRPSELSDYNKKVREQYLQEVAMSTKKHLPDDAIYWSQLEQMDLFVVKAKTSFLAEKRVKAVIENYESAEGTIFVNPSSRYPHLNEVRGVEFYTSIPNFEHKNLGAASAEIAVDRNIPKELVANVQDIFNGLVEDYEKKTDKRVALGMAFAIDELVEEVNKRGGDAMINLSVETGGSIGIPFVDVNKTIPATIIVTGDVIKKATKRKNPPKKPKTIRIEESPNKEKKLVAYFYDKDGKKIKTTHFGARGMSDYTQHKNPDRMKSYLARHGGMGENWKDPMTAGALSRWILWGKPSLRESFNDYKKKFRLEGVMAVTNTRMNPNRIPKKYEGQDPSEHSDLFTDEDPKGTIQGLGFKDKATAERSVNIIKRSGKTHAHKIQAAMAMEQRARFHPNATPGIKAAQKVYAKFIEEMKKKTKRNPKKNPDAPGTHKDEEAYSATHLNGGVGLFVGALFHEEHIGNIAKSLDEVIIVDPMITSGSGWTQSKFEQVAPDAKSTVFSMSIEEYLDNHELPELSIVHFPHRPSNPEEYQGRNIQHQLRDESVLARINEHTDESTIFFNVPGHEGPLTKSNPKKTPEGRKIPKRYLKGLNKEEMLIAAKEIDKGYKYDISDPKAYEYWKSDIQATARGYKTVPSKYKKKFIEMYGPLPEKGEFLDKMAKATKIKKSILQKVYDKGLAAWRGGHRPGVQQHQWAAGRVYSFVTLGNTVKKGNKKMPDYKLAIEAGLVKENPSEADFFPGNKNVAPYYMTAQTIPITALQNGGEWRHGEFSEEDPFEEYF